MKYLLHYSRRLTTPRGQEYTQNEALSADQANYDDQYAKAQSYAYNGVVTVEEVPDEEQPGGADDNMGARVAALEQDNAELREALDALLTGVTA